MTTPVEYGRLKNLGVSAAGIDFISRMLVLDPAARLTEAECLKHAWITGIEESTRPELEMQGVSNTLDVIEESADELDASQLSLVDNPRYQEIGDGNEDLDTEVDEIADTRTSKRFKLDGLDQRQLSEMPLSGDIAYPSLPRDVAPSQRSGNSYAPTNRLFGEIGASALRSSGVLGHDVHVALQMPFEESSAEDSFNTSESQALTHMADGPITSNDGTTKENVQYPQALPASEFTRSASSLLGTEALVGQLNMASLESGASAPSPESTHAPKTPKSREASPLSASAIQGSKRSSQVFHSQSDQTTPKRAKVNQSGAPSQLSQHIDALPQGSDQGLGGESSTQKVRSPSNPPVSTNSKREGTPDNAESILEDKDRVRSIKSVRIDNLTSTEAGPSHPEPALSSLSDTSDIIANADSTFVRPLPRFGVLTTVPGSFCTTTIKLEQRITYYGREPMSHVLHPDKLDRRVPKNALDIIFWRPGIEKLLQEGKDWSMIEGLYAIVHTRTSRSIKINGVKLTKGEGCWNFGRLHTGDVITIFEPPENEVLKGNTTEYLKFRCEFFLGLSAKPREDGSVAFVVEKEEEKFMLNQMRKSQGSLGSQASEENDKEDSQGSSKIGPPQALPGSGSHSIPRK